MGMDCTCRDHLCKDLRVFLSQDRNIQTMDHHSSTHSNTRNNIRNSIPNNARIHSRCSSYMRRSNNEELLCPRLSHSKKDRSPVPKPLHSRNNNKFLNSRFRSSRSPSNKYRSRSLNSKYRSRSLNSNNQNNLKKSSSSSNRSKCRSQ